MLWDFFFSGGAKSSCHLLFLIYVRMLQGSGEIVWDLVLTHSLCCTLLVVGCTYYRTSPILLCTPSEEAVMPTPFSSIDYHSPSHSSLESHNPDISKGTSLGPTANPESRHCSTFWPSNYTGHQEVSGFHPESRRDASTASRCLYLSQRSKEQMLIYSSTWKKWRTSLANPQRYNVCLYVFPREKPTDKYTSSA